MIQIDASFLVVFFIVWILVFALSKLFFHPLRKVMKGREDRIQADKEAYQKSMESLDKAAGEIQERIKAASAQSKQIKENFEREALKEKERILAEISTECRSQVEDAKRQLASQAEKLKKHLDAEANGLAKRIEQKLLQ